MKFFQSAKFNMDGGFIICVMQVGKEPVATQNGNKIQTKIHGLRLLREKTIALISYDGFREVSDLSRLKNCAILFTAARPLLLFSNSSALTYTDPEFVT